MDNLVIKESIFTKFETHEAVDNICMERTVSQNIEKKVDFSFSMKIPRPSLLSKYKIYINR